MCLRLHGGFMKNWSLSLMMCGFIAAATPPVVLAQPSSVEPACSPDALGTSRTLTLKREYVGYGSEQYGRLPLEPGEVVITFDDGPRPETLDRVLKALVDECVKATFYMTGANLVEHPELGRRVVQAGHSAGLHSFAHPPLYSMPEADQLADLDKGLQTFADVFGSEPASYRFPFLAETPAILAALKAKQITVASMDLGIEDYRPNDMETPALVGRLKKQLDHSGGGILLMHDANGPTADALPALLKAIKEKGYKVVHLRWEDAGATLEAANSNL